VGHRLRKVPTNRLIKEDFQEVYSNIFQSVPPDPRPSLPDYHKQLPPRFSTLDAGKFLPLNGTKLSIEVVIFYIHCDCYERSMITKLNYI